MSEFPVGSVFAFVMGLFILGFRWYIFGVAKAAEIVATPYVPLPSLAEAASITRAAYGNLPGRERFVSATYLPGDEKARAAALRAIKALPHNLVAVPPGVQFSSITAGAVGCRYCGRLPNGNATCAGCGAPR